MILPIDEVMGRIRNALREGPNVVIEAPPGAGKTTRVPPALLEFGDVIVLEPRRLAARLAARRVAAERNERVGETVGYQVRFEDVSSPRTRIRFQTEGVLTRRLLSDPDLSGVAVVVLDEFHERHLDGDFALALLRRLQQRRALKLVVMSATLAGDAVAGYLDNCPVVRSEGRLYPIDIAHSPHSTAPVEEQVRDALTTLANDGLSGDVLVFLPGAAEIRRSLRACEAIGARFGMDLVALHGDLSPEEQDRAVTPGSRRKAIFSTNVAESSVTIEGVTAVIDSGLVRVARDSPWTGMASLTLSRISKASAQQRAGRAGRTAPGRAIRLYPLEDFVRRAEADPPEISRRELAGLLLDLHSMGLGVADVPWFHSPPEAAVATAERLLDRLGAKHRYRELARFPVHPRLSVLLSEAGREAAPLAAALANGERVESTDALAISDRDLSPGARQLADRFRRSAGPGKGTPLAQAVLKAFPDRVARRRDGNELLLCGGGSAVLRPGTHWKERFLVALDAEERRDSTSAPQPLVRLAMPIEPEWLLDFFPEMVSETDTLEWNRSGERVEAVSQLYYERLVMEESRSGAVDPEQAAKLLARKAMEAGVERFVDPAAFQAFLARRHFAARHSNIPEPDVEQALTAACRGLRSFAELKQADLLALMNASLDPPQRRALAEVAPERIALPGGRNARIQYSKDKDPWVASRLQDFFGLRETPTVARGAVPLVCHLLAPNQRPVQTTTDLAGFWERLYPRVRKELMRRYPRHAWPEKV
ncbi:MAG: ATP-dependent helicase HrpB [Bryobacteraceae bacterium]